MNWLALSASATVGILLGAGVNVLAAALPRRRFGPSSPSRWRVWCILAASTSLSVSLWVIYGANLDLLPAAVAGLFLLLVAAIDIDRRLVLNEVLATAALASLVYAGFRGSHHVWMALAGGALAFALFFVLALIQRGALGMGDVKLAGVLGLMFGYPSILSLLLAGVLVGGVVSGVLLLSRRVDRKAMIPYAPFLAAGGIWMLLAR